MASIGDISVSAAINLLSALAFLVAFAILRLQPFNDRVYFPKWYLKGIRGSPSGSSSYVKKFVNLDFRTYITFLNWMPAALHMPEPELIEHAGLDSAVYIRIYILGSAIIPFLSIFLDFFTTIYLIMLYPKIHSMKIFTPITLLAFMVLVPVNWTGKTLEAPAAKDLTFSDVDKISISNIPFGSKRFWVHIAMSYVFSFWTCYSLYKEYQNVSGMRLRFLASERRRPDQFTVLVSNVPPDPDESVSEHIEHFFCVNHPDHYLMHQVVYNANKLASIVASKKKLQNWYLYYQNKYEKDPSKRPTTRTGFLGLLGTKVDAIDHYTSLIDTLSKQEEEERKNVTKDPKAVVPAAFVSFKSRWGAAVCAQTQQTSNPTIWLTDWAPEPRDVYWENLAIPYFDLNLRRLLMAVSVFFLTFFFMIPIALVQSLANIEAIEKVLPFLEPIIEKFTKTVGSTIPMKATFFITYIMVDGWAGIAAEILRLAPLITFHLKNTFLVKTEQDRENAMDPGSLEFATSEPRIQLYFMLGHVYSPVTPFLLPFIVVFFAFSYMVFRHQIINVYNQQYESGATFWPDVHRRVIIGLVISQLLLMGLLSTRGANMSTLVLIAQPVLTIWFHRYCKGRFEPAFVQFPLEDAMVKDTLERAVEPNLNLRQYLQDAYIHPVFKGDEMEKPSLIDEEEDNPLIQTKRSSRIGSKPESDNEGGSSW
ncbi:hypothetical protein Lal_00033011 [Lupinus albus]|nr:hypothetical protein Lal_00033011 [Lupinus albus]